MKVYSLFTFLTIAFLSACGTVQVSIERPTPTASLPIPQADAIVPAPIPAPSKEQAMVTYTEEGSVLVWDAATGEGKTVSASGEAVRVVFCDDQEVIVLVRRSKAGVALWAVDCNDESRLAAGSEQ